jgi:hypothetical protein
LTFASAGSWTRTRSGAGQVTPPAIRDFGLRRERIEVAGVPVPTQIRAGVAEGVDAGVRIGMTGDPQPTSAQIGLDVRAEIQRGALDLALDPSILYTDRLHLRPEIPLLLGIHPSRRVQIVLSPGIGYLIALDRSRFDPGPIARAGFGLRAALSESFALFPEVTASHVFAGRSISTVTAGIGVEIGALGRKP